MLPENEVAVGDYVMVHIGYALHKMTPEDARFSLELFEQMLASGPP
jgi:hydrogenase expression/formation protein HypC